MGFRTATHKFLVRMYLVLSKHRHTHLHMCVLSINHFVSWVGSTLRTSNRVWFIDAWHIRRHIRLHDGLPPPAPTNIKPRWTQNIHSNSHPLLFNNNIFCLTLWKLVLLIFVSISLQKSLDLYCISMRCVWLIENRNRMLMKSMCQHEHCFFRGFGIGIGLTFPLWNSVECGLWLGFNNRPKNNEVPTPTLIKVNGKANLLVKFLPALNDGGAFRKVQDSN